MSKIPAVGSLLEIQRDGVRAIQEITGRFDDADWVRPTPCEGWTATDLAGHVLTAINNWHLVLDDTEAGEPSVRFGWAEMDRYFLDLLAGLPEGSGPDRIAQFADRAEEYFDRVAALEPDLPLVAEAFRDIATVPVTVGLFAWIGGNEWHVHAWDFAQTIGEDYRTEHAATFYAGSMALRGRTVGAEDAWDTTLDRFRPQRHQWSGS